MTIVATISIATDDFLLAKRLFDASPVRIDLEALIPTHEMLIPYIRVHNVDRETVMTILQDSPNIKEFEVVDAQDEEQLVRIDWSDEPNGFLAALDSSNGVLLRGTSEGGEWDLTVRFDTHDELAACFDHCRANGIAVDVQHIHNPGMEDGSDDLLTETQRETFQVAYEAGYFEIPRRAGLNELADSLGISDSAVSQRLRRGHNRLVAAYLEGGHRSVNS